MYKEDKRPDSGTGEDGGGEPLKVMLDYERLAHAVKKACEAFHDIDEMLSEGVIQQERSRL